MSPFAQILDNYFSAPTRNEAEVALRAIKRLHPEPHLHHVGYLVGYGSQFQLLEYLKSANVETSVETSELHEGLTWNAGAVVEEQSDGKPLKGKLGRHVQTGIIHFEYEGTKFMVYQVSYIKDYDPYTFFDFIFERKDVPVQERVEDALLLYKYTPPSPHNLVAARLETPAHRLITAAHRYSDATKEEVWVFQNGFWDKNSNLYNAINKASWSELTLPPEFLDGLRRDTLTFFSSREVYEELGVTWKRGLLMLGPPGNGKTESVKALLKESGQTACYVKSFTTSCGPEQGVMNIFKHARSHAPCILVIEDLDSLVTPEVRSFFLNELDGLAENAGILTIATTNHPELIDDAILNRPSRFDVKYTFECPGEELRKIYSLKWMEKAEGEKDESKSKITISFEDKEKTAVEVAKRSDGWSYAFLKELFVSFLLRIAHDRARRTPSQDANKSQSPHSADALLLDQLEKLAIQVNTKGESESEQPKSPDGKSSGGVRYISKMPARTFDAMLGGSSDKWS